MNLDDDNSLIEFNLIRCKVGFVRKGLLILHAFSHQNIM